MADTFGCYRGDARCGEDYDARPPIEATSVTPFAHASFVASADRGANEELDREAAHSRPADTYSKPSSTGVKKAFPLFTTQPPSSGAPRRRSDERRDK
jgi:hypothetical protein